MDLDAFQPVQETLHMTVQDPVTGADTEAVLTLLSPYSSDYLRRKDALARAVLHAALQEKETEDLELRLTAAAIAGWHGLTRGGAPLEYTPDMAEAVLRAYPWLRQQIVFFYNDAQKFFKHGCAN